MEQDKNRRKWFYLVMVIIPFLFIVLLEAGLRILSYGTDYSTFVVLEEISDQYFFNPDLPKKFFTNTTAVPSVLPEPFDNNKSNNTIRVFVFGGSTTAGYPFSANASFPRQIKRKLELVYPTHRIEVINLGVSAVNTHFIRNIMPDVLKHEPDILIIYAGHNEFYGALGPASTEYLSSSPYLIQVLLDLKDFKIYQLVENITQSIAGLFIGEENKSRSTLMSELIKEQEIPNDSEIYESGLTQFRENLKAIFELSKENGVPVIMGNLVSNLKQKPLLSTDNIADEFFINAEKLLNKGDTIAAKENFTKAKDSDLLKFRATEDFNKIIYRMCNEYNFSVVDIKYAFEEHSSGGITGFNLMVDHLHPNLDGYKLMSEQFYNEADVALSKKFRKEDELSLSAIGNYLYKNFPFGRYDSTLSEITIQILLNDYPFTNTSDFSLSSFPLHVYEDTLAMQSITQGLGWASAQLKIFDYYYNKGNYSKAAKTLFILMEGRPFYKSALQYCIPKLITKGITREAKHILVRNHSRYPDFFTSKNLGIININEGNIKLANKLLVDAESYRQNDPEVYFNLSRTYFIMKDFEKAINAMQNCLRITPQYPGAQKIYNRLKKMNSADHN